MILRIRCFAVLSQLQASRCPYHHAIVDRLWNCDLHTFRYVAATLTSISAVKSIREIFTAATENSIVYFVRSRSYLGCFRGVRVSILPVSILVMLTSFIAGGNGENQCISSRVQQPPRHLLKVKTCKERFILRHAIHTKYRSRLHK